MGARGVADRINHGHDQQARRDRPRRGAHLAGDGRDHLAAGRDCNERERPQQLGDQPPESVCIALEFASHHCIHRRHGRGAAIHSSAVGVPTDIGG